MCVQPTGAKLPNTCVSIGTFEVCAPCLGLWVDIPASAPFIGDERAAIGLRHVLNESGINEDRLEAVVDGESMAFNIPQGLGEVMIRLFGENEVRSGGWWRHSPLMLWGFVVMGGWRARRWPGMESVV